MLPEGQEDEGENFGRERDVVWTPRKARENFWDADGKRMGKRRTRENNGRGFREMLVEASMNSEREELLQKRSLNFSIED